MTALERIFGFNAMSDTRDGECKVCGDDGATHPIPETWSIGRGSLCDDCAKIDPAKDGMRRCATCDKWSFDYEVVNYCSRSCRDAGVPVTPIHEDGDYLCKSKKEDA